MAELFINESNGGCISLPAAGSTVLQSSAIAWQDSGAEGFWIKPLLEDNENGL